MAEIRVLKIGSSGLSTEHDSAADDVVFNSLQATASGPKLQNTGLDMNNTDLSEVQDLVFNDPTSGTINQTAGNLIVDNIMAKERSNSLTTAADILFPAISDSAGQVDALRLPDMSAAPTATPTASGEGFVVHYNGAIYVWDGSQWVSQKDSQASAVDVSYTAEVNISARDVVYISSADNVSPADASAESTARVVGFATAAASAAAPVSVRVAGILAGFSGLTTGARYYLSPTTGTITATVPSGNNENLIQVGFAKSATELHIQVVPISIRKS